MTVTTAAPTGAGPATPRGFWRRHTWTLIVVGAVLLALVTAVWTSLGDTTYGDRYDPQNPDPAGGRAVAQVLADQGVDVTVVRSAADLESTEVDAGTTVVVTGADQLSPSTTEGLLDHAAAGRVVVVDPPQWALRDLGARPAQFYGDAGDYPADCADPTFAGLTLTVDSLLAHDLERGGSGCFPSGSGHVLTTTAEGVVLFGAGQALTNDQVLRGDNAAVMLRLLGRDDRLVWYLPSYDDAAAGDQVSVSELLPDWLGPALWTALLAMVGVLLWRFRRLGPLSTEPLPVVVRAVETTHSRGRMYHRSADRAHAAAALRAAARRRLAARLGLDRGAADAAVVAAVAQHLGRPEAEVAWLLSATAPPPPSDGDLVRLAQELDRIDREVRHG